MKPYFEGDERIAKLLFHAERWLETPWSPNSDAIGQRGGVSCHNLPRAILIECGALPATFPKIVGNPNQTRFTTQSQMTPWLDARSELVRVNLDDIRPGDILGLRIYRCVDHLGLALPIGQFIHVLSHKNTCLDYWRVPPWQQRIEAAWRIME